MEINNDKVSTKELIISGKKSFLIDFLCITIAVVCSGVYPYSMKYITNDVLIKKMKRYCFIWY